MKKFILKSIFFLFLTIIIFFWICSKANGYSDPFYLRFTSSKKNSLILGTSRAAQGLQPKIFKSILNEEIFNYSFTVAHSPFGKTYLNSIKKKINTDSKNGTFIIAVDPWSLSSFTKTPNDSLSFRELRLALANTTFVNMDPNIIYLMNNWKKKYYKLIEKKESEMLLHEDGWLEININLDSIDIEKNISNKEKIYRENILPKANISKNRCRYLKKTINFLKKYGEVYLVRIPIHPKIMQIENELMPNFNNDLETIFNSSNGYLDLTDKNHDFIYTDGNHLHKNSGKIVSTIIASWIYDIRRVD